MPENKDAGIKGGKIAKKARLELESKTGKSVITSENYLPPAKKPKIVKRKKGRGEYGGFVFVRIFGGKRFEIFIIR
jgi:hypothetical protein